MYEHIEVLAYTLLLVIVISFLILFFTKRTHLTPQPSNPTSSPQMADQPSKAADQASSKITDEITKEFKDQIPDIPDKESSKEKILKYASDRLQAAENASQQAAIARERAEACEDPEEKKQILAEAEKHERKSKAEMKAVKRIQSGVWQGAGMGGGMGAGLGMGIGAAVGTLLGGIVSIPTTGVGILAGAGTGAVHGPWFKLPGAEGMKENREGKEGDGEEEKGDGNEG